MLNVAYAPKLRTVVAARLGWWMVPRAVREACSRHIGYLTDGVRIWWWADFPKKDSEIPVGLEKFTQYRDMKWITADRPPGAPLSSWERIQQHQSHLIGMEGYD